MSSSEVLFTFVRRLSLLGLLTLGTFLASTVSADNRLTGVAEVRPLSDETSIGKLSKRLCELYDLYWLGITKRPLGDELSALLKQHIQMHVYPDSQSNNEVSTRLQLTNFIDVNKNSLNCYGRNYLKRAVVGDASAHHQGVYNEVFYDWLFDLLDTSTGPIDFNAIDWIGGTGETLMDYLDKILARQVPHGLGAEDLSQIQGLRDKLRRDYGAKRFGELPKAEQQKAWLTAYIRKEMGGIGGLGEVFHLQCHNFPESDGEQCLVHWQWSVNSTWSVMLDAVSWQGELLSRKSFDRHGTLVGLMPYQLGWLAVLERGIDRPGDVTCCPSGRQLETYFWGGQGLTPISAAPLDKGLLEMSQREEL